MVKTDQIRCIEPDQFNTYWDRIMQPLTLPEFIEGNAKGTIRRFNGQYYRKGKLRQESPTLIRDEQGTFRPIDPDESQ